MTVSRFFSALCFAKPHWHSSVLTERIPDFGIVISKILVCDVCYTYMYCRGETTQLFKKVFYIETGHWSMQASYCQMSAQTGSGCLGSNQDPDFNIAFHLRTTWRCQRLNRTSCMPIMCSSYSPGKTETELWRCAHAQGHVQNSGLKKVKLWRNPNVSVPTFLLRAFLRGESS